MGRYVKWQKLIRKSAQAAVLVPMYVQLKYYGRR